MKKKLSKTQIGLSGLLLLILAVAVILGLNEFRKPNYAQHLQDAREYVGKPEFTSTSNECNKKLTCADGSEFYLYFYSTNDGKFRMHLSLIHI